MLYQRYEVNISFYSKFRNSTQNNINCVWLSRAIAIFKHCKLHENQHRSSNYYGHYRNDTQNDCRNNIMFR
ncbi:MAG: hypothetical protein F6K17_35350 [Okeania sp. SIO3C4]|nr:hypothetical protein [Okeania sp. SIO3C4]